MARDDETQLYLSLEARFADFEKRIQRAERTGTRSFQELQRASRTATAALERDTIRATTRINQAMATTSQRIGGFGKAFALAFASSLSFASFQKFSDSATKITNALRVAGLEGEKLNDTFETLYSSAQRNGAPIEALAQLYSRVSLVQKQLGVSSEQILGLTDTVAKAIRVSGGDAESASGALLQLAQALGSSRIQAEEWNSLIDGMPALLQAAAAGIRQAGGDVSKLTQLVKSGKISNKAFFDGIAAGAGVLDEKLAGTTQTIGQMGTELDNALTRFVRSFNAASGSGTAFGNTVEGIINYLNTVNVDNLVEQIGRIVSAVETATAGFMKLLNAANQAAGIDTNRILDSIVPKAGDTTGSYLYRSLFGTDPAQDKAKSNAEARLEIEQKIAELREQSGGADDLNVQLNIQRLEGDLAQIKSDFVQPRRPISLTPAQKPAPFQGPNKPAFTATPIDINDPKYAPGGSASGSKGSKSRTSDFDRATKSIQERITALNAETAAQAGVNPLINDYDRAINRASVAQDLLSAAQESGTAAGKELHDVAQLLAGNFDGLSPKAREQAQAMLALANGYADARAQADQLAEKQEHLRRTAEEWRDVSQSATKAFITDLIEGKSAASALTGALQKIADVLLDQVLDSIFQVKSAGGAGGGGIGGIFGSIVSLFSAKGNAFDNGHVQHFAKGGAFTNGVVNRPTNFNIGQMGEKGPEAILPLARDGSGRLGVSAHGGGGQGSTNVHVTVGIDMDEDGRWQGYVKNVAQTEASSAANGAVGQYDKALPGRVQQIQRNPRRR
ncbi:tape measure protein [Rhizobium sp. BE258]|uniref:tape measure protein n=1 Tax=Rhizobium sp. BE258 TaxID=2817722 RepID=UPI0028591052|nr:tape measure protein [Rhizobium sp. BE258]MDR7147049.1 tape measure domain-containing protein [Rhizobium sp. BE258]